MTPDDPLSRLANEHRHYRWATALRTFGWLGIIGYTFSILAQLRRASAITESPFPDGVWGQRMETLAFVSFPQQMVPYLLGAAAAIAAAAAVPAAVDRAEIGVNTLLRAVDVSSYIVIAVGGFGLYHLFRQGFDSFSGVIGLLQRLVGPLLAAGVIRLVREAERPV